jgi:hypothetical protein
MSALSAQRPFPIKEVWDQKKFTLKTSTACWKGGMCSIDTSTGGVVKPSAGGANQVFIGFFTESLPSSAAGTKVNVQLGRKVNIVWLENTDTGNTVAATDLGKVCYLKDDQTVTMSSAGSATKAGRVWGISTINGVACAAVELFYPANGDS